jgi:AbrB family looped-hinge helix DNA binding protein
LRLTGPAHYRRRQARGDCIGDAITFPTLWFAWELNCTAMWHILRMAHSDPFPVQLGDRGRLVLPAELCKRLNLREGDELLVTVQPDGSLRLASPRQAVRETRGLYRARAGGRLLSDELIAERRAEVKRQTSQS